MEVVMSESNHASRKQTMCRIKAFRVHSLPLRPSGVKV